MDTTKATNATNTQNTPSTVITTIEWSLLEVLIERGPCELTDLVGHTQIPPHLVFQSLQYLIIKNFIRYKACYYHLNNKKLTELKSLYHSSENKKLETLSLVESLIKNEAAEPFHQIKLKRILLTEKDVVFLKSLFRQIEMFIDDAKRRNSRTKINSRQLMLLWGANWQDHVVENLLHS